MRLGPLRDIHVRNLLGVVLSDYITETRATRAAASRIGREGFRREFNEEEHGLRGVNLCTDAIPGIPLVDPPIEDSGNINFVVWRNAQKLEILGALLLYNVIAEVDTPRAFACRSALVPLGRAPRGDPWPTPAVYLARMMRHLLDQELGFVDGRRFHLIEWTFPTYEPHQWAHTQNPNQRSHEVLEHLVGRGDEERHVRDELGNGSARRVRHRRRNEIKRELERAVDGDPNVRPGR